jgi:chloride channel 3/4/5
MTKLAAAGVSVAFGAPIGGVLFSLEEVSYYFPYKTMWRSFFCAMIAAISLRLINPFRTGKLVLFQVEYKRDWHLFELPFFVVLGVLGGLYGAFFIKSNLRYSSLRKNSWLKDFPIMEVLCVSLLSGILNFPFKFLRTNTSELVANLFRECAEVDVDFHGLCNYNQTFTTLVSLLWAAVAKIFLTILTFGIKVPAGIFVPSMAIGACVGRMMGILIEKWHEYAPNLFIFSECFGTQQCVTPGTYAVIGNLFFN